MPIITSKILGINEADPKPATCINYAGQPMRPGDAYNGRPEHMANASESPPARLRQGKAKLTREEIAQRIRAGQERARALCKVFGFKSQRKAKSDA